VRTRSSAFARIKFEAGLLWVLRAVSHMELRAAVAGAANTNTIRVRLESGKAVATWTPDRQTATGKAAGAVARAVVETPSGQAAIQGTEWSLNVEDDGRTALVVLTGSVELSNALGAVTVGANEAAEMRVGQAPTLLRIVNPRDRVQWVADYAAQPLRYADAAIGSARADFDLSVADAAAGRPAAAIERLARLTAAGAAPPGVTLALADLLIGAGELERARMQLEAARTQQPADARFDALLSRIALFEGRTADSRALANQATTKEPNTVDGWLALGESAQSDGDGPIARQAFQQATAVAPDDARGWYGRGSVETDYEAFVPARRWLTRALTLDPKGPGYRGEMGTVETLANNFSAAKREFAQALTDRRDDYVALTGRALLALKEGREPEALDLLLRATLIEPNYARAQVYLGVTYYRLRRHDDAIRALHKASRLDPKDPLPYLMVSAIHTDLYAPSEAIVAARQARDLMPNLKSLNQLASTQKGTANLGNSVSFFGLEQWAQHLAQESYYPFWAGSHLFLGDRYESAYARTSE
ncbi:MAG: tetratricopeptide repeat protein, partial [Acidobacteriota bacterium]|nr:tetratricopeptide repeat protein [Acidobacteriota bacterium]